MIDVPQSARAWNAVLARPFTPAELEVVIGIVSGMPNKEIAMHRSTCERTSKMLASQAYRKIGLPIEGGKENRIKLLRWTLANGLELL